MKTTLTALAILFVIPLYSQMRTMFNLEDFDNVWKVRDSISAMISPKFHYEKIDSGEDFRARKAFTFYWVDSTGAQITASFYRAVHGGNPYLNIPGKFVIAGFKMMGPYMDLFPIWQTIWDKQADLVKTSTERLVSAGKIDLTEKDYVHPYFEPGRAPAWIITCKVLPPI